MSYCPSTSPIRPDFIPGLTTLADGRRSCSDRNAQSFGSQDSLPSLSCHSVPFESEWSMLSSRGKSPDPKAGQTVVYWAERKWIICAYGRNRDDSLSSEFWRFSTIDCTWEILDVQNVSPRAGCGSALIESKLWFFGGITTSSFVRDLHYVDLNTLEVVYPITTGEHPPPCAMPLLAYFYPFIIVWAGTSGSNLSSLHILNIEEMQWTQIVTENVGRQGACGAIIGSTLYIYGASCPMSILALDLRFFEFSLIPTTGTEPPHGLECLTTVAVGDTFLAFETIGFRTQTKIYVFDPQRANWMSYAVTIGEDDIDKVCTPRIVFYLPDDRKLLALCEGADEVKQPLTELSIGRSIASLNQRLDLLSMLNRPSV